MKAFALAVVLVLMAATCASAVTTIFENFDSYTAPGANGTIMFRQPSFSGSTSAQIDSTDPANNVAQVLTEQANSLANSLKAQWLWQPAGTWLRYTTYNTATRPNPSVDLTQSLVFKVLYPAGDPLGVVIGIRDNGNAAANGADGTGSGAIEWVGATGTSSSMPTGYTHTLSASPNWQILTFNFVDEPKTAFTGDGILQNTRGTFESIAFVRTGAAGPVTLFLDDFEVVPEPGSLLALGAGLASMLGLIRRKR